MRVILAGGGTGGHVIPALAIAQQLKKEYAAEVLFMGTPRGMENRLVPAAGFELRLVQVGALKNVSLATRLRTALDLPLAILRGVRTIAFEPNVVPGFANRVVARWVSAAAVHFQQTCRYFPNCRVTGVPVRAAFFSIASRPAGSQPTLLVFGGSQGAKAINEAMIASLAGLREKVPNLRIIHQTGERDYDRVRAAYEQAGNTAEVFKFIDDMPGMFAQADLLVCRSGASTVGEITAAGKPAIFVPFPRAADDHQNVNARALEHAGAAIVIEESKLEGAYLVDTIAALIGDARRLERMSGAARSLAHPKAVEEIAGTVRDLSAG